MSNSGEMAGGVAALERELRSVKAELAEAIAARIEAAAGAAELASLKEEYEALRAEYTLINQELSDRSAELFQLRSQKGAATAAGELASSSTSGPAEALGFDSSGFPSPDSDILFLINPSLSAVPCDTPDDVIELRVSVNAIRITTDHSGVAHKCSAYICGVRRNGAREIYLALHQIENDRSLIYVPSRQPVDAGDYDRVMESAIDFTDVTGFIVNLVALGSSAQERSVAISQIPVLKAG